MKRYLVFQMFCLVAEVTYRREINSISYVTSRRIVKFERFAIECYILHKIAQKFGYYDSDDGMLVYHGADRRVLDEYREDLRRIKDKARQDKLAREKDIDDVVKALMATVQK